MMSWSKSPISPPSSWRDDEALRLMLTGQSAEWQKFALGHFLRESDDVEYTLADAEEVYQR